MSDFDAKVNEFAPGLERESTPFPFPVYRAGDGWDAMDAWILVYDARATLGHLPVIFGNVNMLAERYAQNERTAEQYIEEAKELMETFSDPPEMPEPSSAKLREAAVAKPSSEAWDRVYQAAKIEQRHHAFGPLPEYQWEPSSPTRRAVSIPFHPFTGDPLPDVCIGLIPTLETREVLAHLKFGGWHECPPPAEQVAWWDYWDKRHDVTIAAVSHDRIEAYPLRPPTTKDDAIRLARQQQLYCRDIVSQGYGSVEALAAKMLRGKSWFFWWD